MKIFIPLVLFTLGLPLPSNRAPMPYRGFLKLHSSKGGDINGGSDEANHHEEFELRGFTANGGATSMVFTTGLEGLPLVLEALLHSDNASASVSLHRPSFKNSFGHKETFEVKVQIARITSVTLHNHGARITIVAVSPVTITDSLGHPFTGALPEITASDAGAHDISATVVAEHRPIQESGRGPSKDVPIREFDWTIGMGSDGKTPGVGTLTFAKDSDGTSTALIDAAARGQKLDGTELTWRLPPNQHPKPPSSTEWDLHFQAASFAGVAKVDNTPPTAAHPGKATETYTVNVTHFQLADRPIGRTVQW